MADLKRFELEELASRPGTYYNPDTEVTLIVDDSAHAEAELLGDGDDGEWILVSDDIPVDEHRRDELLERLQVRAARAAERDDVSDDEEIEEEDQLEPDEDYDEDDY